MNNLLTYTQIKENLKQRYWNKRSLGVPTDSRGNSEEVDLQAGLAEYHVAQVLHCPFNSDVLNGNDGGFDMLYKGYKLDVKWIGWIKGTKQPRLSGRIIVDLDKLTSDIYVAVSGSESDGFNILGWCWKEDLLNEPIWKSTFPDKSGRYERYAIHTNKLRKL